MQSQQKSFINYKENLTLGTYYHLDRTGSLEIGQTISLEPTEIFNCSIDHLIDHANELFEKGISRHGLQYINQRVTDDSLSEWFFEYVRRSNFTDKPSRFQSFFALSSLEDIQKFKKRFNISSGNVYLIESENYFKADMNLVGLQTSPLSLSLLANTYWSGNTREELYAKNDREPLWEYLLTGSIKVIGKVE